MSATSTAKIGQQMMMDSGFNMRSQNVLIRLGARLFCEVLQLTEEKILKSEGGNAGTVSDIRRTLAEFGFTLEGSDLYEGKKLHDLGIDSSIIKGLERKGIASQDALVEAYRNGDLSRKFPKTYFKPIATRLRTTGRIS